MVERRPPLTPSDNRNAPSPSPRRPRTKEISSRYLSTPSTSTSYSTSAASARRSPSPSVTSRSQPTPVRRSSSVDRTRPSSSSTSTSGTSSGSVSTNTMTMTMTRSLSVSFQGESFSYSTSRPKASTGRRSVDNCSRPWPAAVRSLDYSGRGSSTAAEENQVNGGEVSCSSDTESISSGSNTGSQEFALPPRASSRVSSRGIQILPVKYSHENNSSNYLRVSPRPIHQPSPNKNRISPSPIRSRQVSQPNPKQHALNAPSILNFTVEVRRAKKGEYRIEEAHLLRLLDNRELQIRFVNSRASEVLRQQSEKSEKKMYNAWRNIGELRESVALKRMKLQYMKMNMNLASILKRQVLYLDEWAKMETEHSKSLFEATEALKASTLRLPLVSGAQADVKKLEEVINSSMEVINAVESYTHFFLPKIFKISLIVNDLASVLSQEHLLLAQSRDLLSTFTALHVKQCSLQGQIIQLKSELKP